MDHSIILLRIRRILLCGTGALLLAILILSCSEVADTKTQLPPGWEATGWKATTLHRFFVDMAWEEFTEPRDLGALEPEAMLKRVESSQSDEVGIAFVYYYLAAQRSSCGDIASICRFDSKDSPLLKLCKYHLLITSCAFAELSVDYLLRILEDPNSEALVKCEIICMTRPHVPENAQLGKREGDLAHLLRAFCEMARGLDPEAAQACEEITLRLGSTHK